MVYYHFYCQIPDMKKIMLLLLPAVLLLSGCSRCGKNVHLGDFSLINDTRDDWYPYRDVSTLTFTNGSGAQITLSRQEREETIRYVPFREICTEGWADTSEEFYRGEWLQTIYSGTFSIITYRLGIIVSVEHLFNYPSLVLYDRAAYSSYVAGVGQGTAVGGSVNILASKRGNSFNPNELPEFDTPDFASVIEINGKNYSDVWYFDRQGTPSLYVQQGYGIIAFAGLNNEVWVLKP